MALKDFWNGVACDTVESLPNPDCGRKMYMLIEKIFVSIFAKIVDPEVIIRAYLDNNDMLIIRALREYGISEREFMEFTRLIGEAKDPNTREKDSFADAQNMLLEMFRKKVETLVSMGEIRKDSVRAVITTFSKSSLIYGKEDLRSTYPFNDLSYLRLDKGNVESAVSHNIRLAEENCEQMQIVRPARYLNNGEIFTGPRQVPIGGRHK